MNVLGIDPGLQSCGLASYRDGEIVAWTMRPKSLSLEDRVLEICDSAPIHLNDDEGVWDLVVIEMPQVYRGYQDSDPNDMVMLAVLVGGLVSRILTDRFMLPFPATWKGQVPKKIHHARLSKWTSHLGRCSADARDAVGLCLYGVDHA